MEQVRPLTSLSTDELIARIEQYMVVVELRDAEIRELHAANSALLAERDALIHDNSEYVSAANELATENQRLREALEASIEQMEYDAAKIDGEWGDCRSIDELERDGELPEALVLARAALAQEQGGSDDIR